MKKYIYSLFKISLVLSVLSSCQDVLDTHPSAFFSEDNVWSTKETIQAFTNAAYAEILPKSSYAGSGCCVTWESRTPNSIYVDQRASAKFDTFVTELGITTDVDYGCNRFTWLRKCNLIIEKVNASESLNDADKKLLSAPGHLLRGMIFFDQARKIGRFVPMCQVLSATDSIACGLPLTKDIAESYTYVISDLEKAAEGLPNKASKGLPTKWAAKVILSRACLQAYAYTKDSKYLDKAYEAAKDCVKNSGIALTTSKGMFDGTDPQNAEILWAYYALAEKTTMQTYVELINTFPLVRAGNMQNANCTHVSVDKNGLAWGGWVVYHPTQEMVDQYLVKDDATGEALPWYQTSQYKNNVEELDPSVITKPGQIDSYTQKNGTLRRMPTPENFLMVDNAYPNFSRYDVLKPGVTRTISDIMYSNRDLRFYANIAYDGCKWVCDEWCDTNLQGNLSQGVTGKEEGADYTTITGYYWRKNNRSGTLPRAHVSVNTDYSYNIARLGEAYMNLAEACILKGLYDEAREAINGTRVTHGGLPASKASTSAELWADYIRERNCEMCNESADTYFSYLRWGMYGGDANHGRTPGDIIPDLDRPVSKIQIDRERKTILIGQVTLLNQAFREFTPKRYTLPLYRAFLSNREAYGLDCAQNEGW